MDFLANPLIVSYLALAVAVLTAIRVFLPGEAAGPSKATSAPAAPAPAPSPAPAPATAFSPVLTHTSDDEAVVAAIVAALSLYAGSGFTVRSIRPAAGGGNLWTMAGRIENTASI